MNAIGFFNMSQRITCRWRNQRDTWSILLVVLCISAKSSTSLLIEIELLSSYQSQPLSIVIVISHFMSMKFNYVIVNVTEL